MYIYVHIYINKIYANIYYIQYLHYRYINIDINDELSEKEIRITITFIIASKILGNKINQGSKELVHWKL